jgi:hypothetical protein
MFTVRKRREAGCKQVDGGQWSASPWLDQSVCL